MHEIFNMLLAAFDRAALMLICLFFLIRIRLFRELLHKSAHSQKNCSPLPPFSRCSPCSAPGPAFPQKVAGELPYYRGRLSGGILFGPWVGIITGVIAGIHRYLIDIGGVTAILAYRHQHSGGLWRWLINLKIPRHSAGASVFSAACCVRR